MGICLQAAPVFKASLACPKQIYERWSVTSEQDFLSPRRKHMSGTIYVRPISTVIGGSISDCQAPNHYDSLSISAVAFLSLCSRQKIERSTLRGTNREVIVSTTFLAFGLTVYGQHVYWSDISTKKIYRANKYDGSALIAMTTPLPVQPRGIARVIKTQPQQCSNPCDQFNGGCSHICAPGKGLSRNTV